MSDTEGPLGGPVPSALGTSRLPCWPCYSLKGCPGRASNYKETRWQLPCNWPAWAGSIGVHWPLQGRGQSAVSWQGAQSPRPSACPLGDAPSGWEGRSLTCSFFVANSLSCMVVSSPCTPRADINLSCVTGGLSLKGPVAGTQLWAGPAITTERKGHSPSRP